MIPSTRLAGFPKRSRKIIFQNFNLAIMHECFFTATFHKKWVMPDVMSEFSLKSVVTTWYSDTYLAKPPQKWQSKRIVCTNIDLVRTIPVQAHFPQYYCSKLVHMPTKLKWRRKKPVYHVNKGKSWRYVWKGTKCAKGKSLKIKIEKVYLKTIHFAIFMISIMIIISSIIFNVKCNFWLYVINLYYYCLLI